MGVKKFIKKSVAFVAAAAMALTMVVTPVGAGAGTSYAAEGTEDNLHLNKGIELDSSGNYKITLEAYSTGKDTTTVTDKAVPLDIVLVLDQSGSMEDGFTSYTYTKQSSKKYSYNDLTNEVYYKDSDKYYKVERYEETKGWVWNKTTYYYMYYEKDGEKHYLYDEGKYGVTDSYSTIWTGELYTRQEETTTRLEALKSAVTNFVTTVEQKAEHDKVDHRIAIVGFASEKGYGNNTEVLSVSGTNSGSVGVRYNGSGYESAIENAFQDTRTDSGNTMLKNAIDALAANGATNTGLGMKMANDILIKDAKKNETGRKKLVIMFTDGTPTTQTKFDTGVANTAISNAKEIKSSNAKVYSIGIFNGADPSSLESSENKFMNYVSSNYPDASKMDKPGTGANSGYYKAASNSADLINIFESIPQSETSSGTTVELKSDSVLRDIISKNFELPKGVEASAVSVYTADSKSVSSDGKDITWETEVPDTSNKYPVTIDGNKVDVTGFDYSQNYVTPTKKGQKLIVEIIVNGLCSGMNMDSNDTEQAKSGIYKNSTETTAVKNFVSPKVDIPEYSYVLDYGNKVVLNNTDAKTKNTYNSEQTKAYQETTMINTAKAAPNQSKTIKLDYGTFTLADNTLSYQPEKIKWDGFDSIFALGKKDSSDTPYEWYKTNIIPASSVYYEDDFNSTNDENSSVKIVWGGTWDTQGSDKDKDRVQSSDNSVYGWEEKYSKELGYSGGSAHWTNTAGATATFTFKGTGVDVYSRTKGDVGAIYGVLYDGDSATKSDGTVKTAKKVLYVDNRAESGDYYQVPTLSFDGLPYGTYTVQILAGIEGESGSGLYYLDGIRVYNPVKEDNVIVQKAYDQAGESKAKYIRLRDTLVKSGFGELDKDTKGSVFIDKMTTTKVTTGTPADYDKYGPKNEVYLSKGQGVAFKIKDYSEGNNVFVGLKVLDGSTEEKPTATITNKTGQSDYYIESSADLYYQIYPTTDGKVIIKNNTDNILSITKIRITGVTDETNDNGDAESMLMATQDLLPYAQEFNNLSKVEKPSTDDTDGDVDIDNPTENPSDNDKNDNDKPQNSIWNKILNGLKNWFGKM